MTSQLMVKINVAPFSQVNKTKSGVNSELVTVSRSPDGASRIFDKTSENVRIAQLEQNIKFLQDQHQIMLNDLHNEIEDLRNKNRDLQFLLVFDKNQPLTPQTSSSTSSSDDEHKIFSSPNQLPTTQSLQVELLEKMVGDMKIQLQENESRNVYLSAIVDEQKKKLEKYERDRERERERTVQAEPEMRRKFEEADAIIRRLQQENNVLRREATASLSPSHYRQQSQNHHGREGHGAQRVDGSHQNRENAHAHNRENGQSFHKGGRGNRRHNSMNYRGNWFPPLHSQNYWQGGSGGNRGGNADKRSNCGGTENALPNLNGGGQHQQERRGGGGNNNHHQNGDGVRHRNGQKKGIEPS